MGLRQTALLAPFALFVGGICAAVIRLTLRLVHEHALALIESVRTGAAGVDIIASHDPVSSAMIELGESRRLRPVAQCGSLLFDHTRYFRNGCSALPLVADEIERAAGWKPPDNPPEAAAYHHGGLAIRRLTRPWLVVAAPIMVVAFVAPTASGGTQLIVAVGAGLATYVGLSRSCLRWLQTASWVAKRPRYAAAMELLRRERPKRAWIVVLLLVAHALIGGSIVVVAASDQSFDPTGYRDISVIAGLVGWVLVICIWFSLFGLRWADWAAIVCLIVSAPLWFAHRNGAGPILGGMTLTLVVCGAWRARRFSRRRCAVLDDITSPG